MILSHCLLREWFVFVSLSLSLRLFPFSISSLILSLFSHNVLVFSQKAVPLQLFFFISGSGTVVAAATTAAGRDPIILGKPSTYMFEALTITHPEVQPSRTLMIGDK
jgi:hypothetical protein